MTFEDELRAAMLAHDEEAPTETARILAAVRATGDQPTPRRRGWLWPAAAAAAVVLVTVGVVTAVHSARPSRGGPAVAASRAPSSIPASSAAVPSAAQVAAACPARVESKTAPLSVPAPPHGVSAGDRLVPDRVPSVVIVCAYLQGETRTGARALSGNLGAVTNSLTWLPPPNPTRQGCLSYLARTDFDSYLIQLRYGSATVWVAAPGNHCTGASNGEFSTSSNLRDLTSEAYTSGRWPSSAQVPGNDVTACGAYGRLGQQTTMVPGQPDSVTICRHNHAPQTTTDVAALVAALNHAPTRVSTGTAQCTDNIQYVLRFDYASGPSVSLTVMPGCTPQIDNGSLTSNGAANVTRLLPR